MQLELKNKTQKQKVFLFLCLQKNFFLYNRDKKIGGAIMKKKEKVSSFIRGFFIDKEVTF
ncbi:MAG TPA: hypothetical protein DIC43_07885 [Vagococcus sp.]|nr:hypothetical protein [Vagococcus sp.]